MNLFFVVFCLIVLLPNSMSKLIHNRCKLTCKASNHKNYNFVNCDWFKKLLFPTNSLAKLLSDSLLSDSLLSDSLLSDSSTNRSHSKL